MESYTPRPVDNLLWPEGSVRLPVPSGKSFHDIWKHSCSNVHIRKHCKDTCLECFVLSNRFHYHEAQDRDDDSDGSNSDRSDSEHYPYEDLIEQASNHAEEAQQQRRLAKYRHQQAMDESKEPHKNRRFFFFRILILFYFYHETKVFLFCSYCLIGDYAQNLELPHFGAEQPQDIYYFSALTVNVFGLAEVTKSFQPPCMLMVIWKIREERGATMWHLF
jgi:hypothetical protein